MGEQGLEGSGLSFVLTVWQELIVNANFFIIINFLGAVTNHSSLQQFRKYQQGSLEHCHLRRLSPGSG